PNTPGLRQLQEREPLLALLRACVARLAERAPGKPLLLKFAPDLEPEAMDELVDVAIAAGISGLVATNTTVSRLGVESHPRAKEAGGLSGAPLERLATAAVRRCYARAGGRLVIVGCGGILTAEDAYAKIRAGATLVQGYSGLIFQGPRYARAIHDGLVALLRRDGFTSLEEAVGADHRRTDALDGASALPPGGVGPP
ncbi:MAG TPA: dihydroorotate dehydrogenase (quinone), partial [Anaeromyxobacteraceae bacterium]|nr:dihydroorotate dehydrogenase (quinone) [Anaeromyxobacteraceae bacterium]